MPAKNVYFAGTAGCGKSTLTNAFQTWLSNQGFDSVTVNLDPGVESLMYVPDVDVRDWIKLSEIMAEYGLGPNGAQIVASDMLALNIKEIADVLAGYDTDYVIFDTPGQIELFAFRQSSRHVIDELGRDSSVLMFLFDPALARTPSGYISSLMLAATTHFRIPVPITKIMAKSDMLSDTDRERIASWGSDMYSLFAALTEDAVDAQTQISVELLQALETVGVDSAVIPVSSETGEGLEDIYSSVQMSLEGGEDVEKD
jgi:GTPase SAR1 family protein